MERSTSNIKRRQQHSRIYTKEDQGKICYRVNKEAKIEVDCTMQDKKGKWTKDNNRIVLT